MVKGDPSDEELAALVAVVSAVAAAQVTTAAKPVSPWSAPARGHRTPLAAGRGGWRASSLPR
nr:acyl-CoA carboxylase epsilon subunit [Nocardioides panacis]